MNENLHKIRSIIESGRRNKRKELKLSYDDRIVLSIEAAGIYGQSISSHKDWLMEQSLAVDLKTTVKEPMFEKNDADGQLKIHVQKAKTDR